LEVYLTNSFWELYQLYNLSAVEDKDEPADPAQAQVSPPP